MQALIAQGGKKCYNSNMNRAFPNSTRSVFRSFGVPRPTRPTKSPTMTPPAKPFYQQAAKKQMQQYLKIAGGKSYLKSPFEKAFKQERSAFEHGQRQGLTKEELYAFSKVSHGGAITKEKAKLIAGAAVEIARERQAEAGSLAHGLGYGKLTEAERKIMRVEHAQEPKPEPVKIKRDPTSGQRLAALEQRLHIQHGPLIDRPTPSAGMGLSEPTPLSGAPTPGAETTRPAAVGHWQTLTEEPTPLTTPPAAPRLSQFSSGFTGGIGTVPHPVDQPPAPGSPLPTLPEKPNTPPEPAATEPPSQPPASQIPDTSHVDEGLPF